MLGLLLTLSTQTAAVPAEDQRSLPPIHGGPAPMTCPVGGETFNAWRPTMYSTYGERPDGRPYSYLSFPLPIPECPGNGLVVFRSFTPAEVDMLRTLIATPAYRTLIANGDTSYYRAFWLAEKLARPTDEVMGLLLSATWQVKGGQMADPDTPARRAMAHRYQDEFIRRARQLPRSTAAPVRGWIELRAANALRELGRFGNAEAMRRRAAQAQDPHDAATATYLDKLATVIARRDPSLEPLDLIPEPQARYVCADAPATMSAADHARCAMPPLAGEAVELRRMQSERPPNKM